MSGGYRVGLHLSSGPLQGTQLRKIVSRVQHLHGFGPDASIIGDKGHVTVIDLLPHRHLETDTKGGNHISVFIAVIDKGVYHPNLLTAGIEIQTDSKREKRPTRRTRMSALHLDDSTHTTSPFHANLLNLRHELVVFQRGHQRDSAPYPTAIHTETVEQGCPDRWKVSGQFSRVHHDLT